MTEVLALGRPVKLDIHYLTLPAPLQCAFPFIIATPQIAWFLTAQGASLWDPGHQTGSGQGSYFLVFQK